MQSTPSAGDYAGAEVHPAGAVWARIDGRVGGQPAIGADEDPELGVRLSLSRGRRRPARGLEGHQVELESDHPGLRSVSDKRTIKASMSKIKTNS